MPRTFPPKVLTRAEVASLLSACGDANWIDVRNRALAALLYRTGLRVSEALALLTSDVDLEAGTARVLRGKGWAGAHGEDRPPPRPRPSQRAQSVGLGHPPGGALFCSTSGRPMTDGDTHHLFAALGHRAGIAKRVHPHDKRHTCALELREEGVDVFASSHSNEHDSIQVAAALFTSPRAPPARQGVVPTL